MITFLDCTLRDGGYYNNWDFEPKKASELIKALNEARVHIIEVGYKSPFREGEYAGLFKNCNEYYLDFLSKNDFSDYCFMIDVKEFLRNNKLNLEELNTHILDSDNSVFSMVRLASHYQTIDTIEPFTDYFRQKGYKVCFNLMGGSLLSMEQILNAINIAIKANVDVFYIADSFGSFYPDEIRKLIRFIKDRFKGKIGIHAHDNQGLAYANTLVAIDEGVDFVDGTVTGMGRGAGNLLTEQFLLGYSQKNTSTSFQPTALLEIVNNYLEPMRKIYKWGYNYTYMVSGLMNIHPLYCQYLAESGRFNSSEVNCILEAIPVENRSKFTQSNMEKAIATVLHKGVFENEVQKNVLDAGSINLKIVIIVARGSSAKTNIPGLKRMAERNNASFIECGDTEIFKLSDERIMILLNQVRVKAWHMKPYDEANKIHLITGHPATGVSSKSLIYHYFPFTIGEFNILENQLVIPDYDAGLYAIGLAIRCGAQKIFLAGFDGYENVELNNAKDVIYSSIQRYILSKNITIEHITPTQYKTFKQKSLYTL